ncbi:MAG: sugar ABC transporter permease [Caldilineaceae bacterium]|nr:sugar ABC transporter permease [Caldilineaceae bacterium]
MTTLKARSHVGAAPIKNRWGSTLWKRIVAHQALILMFLPGLIFFIVFNYIPMGGIVLAFKKYNVLAGIWGSEWVGFDNFAKFFGSYYANRIIRNAILLNLMTLLFSFPMPILLAILLNEVRYNWFKRTVQTITYFPYFIAAVVMVGIVKMLLSPDISLGIFNRILVDIFRLEPINFLARPEHFRSIYVLMAIWQGTGFGAIIYLATLASVDLEQYEAAIIDGANRLQLIRYVTIPALLPTVIILLILSISGLMRSGLETILLLYSPATYETADVIETFVYRRGIVGEGGGRPDYSFATAVGLFQSVVGLILIVVANQIAKKLSDNSLW